MTDNSETIVLAGQVQKSDLPAPGTWAEVLLSNGMTAQVWNLRPGQKVDRQPKTLSYVPVRSMSTDYRSPIHAAVYRRRHGRARLDYFTLCQRGDPTDPDYRGPVRHVDGQVYDAALDDVSCTQCRAQLVEDGMLDS